MLTISLPLLLLAEVVLNKPIPSHGSSCLCGLKQPCPKWQTSASTSDVSNCSSWRVIPIFYLNNRTVFSGKAAVSKRLPLQVTKSCQSDSHYQVLSEGSNCELIKAWSNISEDLETTALADGALSITLEELASLLCSYHFRPRTTEDLLTAINQLQAGCTRRKPLEDRENGLVVIFSECGIGLTGAEESVLKELLLQGYFVRIFNLRGDRDDCERGEYTPCPESFSKCLMLTLNMDNSSMADLGEPLQICPLELADDDGGGGGSKLSTLEVVLLTTVPVVAICLIACCCIWSFYRKTVRQAILQAVLNHHSVKEMQAQLEKQQSMKAVHFVYENQSVEIPRCQEDVWQVCQEDLEILDNELLGKGAFAKVVKGRLKGTIPLLVVNATINLVLDNLREGVCEVAVKRLPPHGDQQGVIDFLKEIEFMKQLGYHAHVISMIGCIVSPVSPVILLEYCYHGDLLTFLRKNRPHVLMSDDEDCPVDAELCLRIFDLISFGWQISDGMTYLHSKGWIHRDLACRNILLTKSMVAKVSDFGLCRYADSALYVAKGGRLPVKWMAIESLKRFEFSTKSDAWSFGVLLYELFSLGDTPYPTVQPVELLTYLEADHRIEQPQICPNEVYALMTSCWDEEASSRPSFDEIRARLRKMLNIEDEYYGYVTLENPKSVRYMLNREISEFPATEPKISAVSAFDFAESDDDPPEEGEFHRYPSTSDMDDFYSTRSRFSTMKTRRETRPGSMEIIPEEIPPASESDDLETWSITTVTEDRPRLEFSDVLSTCQIYPHNYNTPDLTNYDAEMADFYR